MNALVIGTGEYVSGYVHGKQTDSDKPIGVVSVTLFDLKRRGKVSNISLCGTNGTKFPYIREHFREKIQNVYKDMDVSFTNFPNDTVESNSNSYKEAILSMTPKRDVCFIFTPDHLHYEIALFALNHGLHVYVAKPLVQELQHHIKLMEVAAKQGVILAVEVHKRWDPIYSDAWTKIRNLEKFGDFSFFNSYMSQPHTQLNTFSDWIANSDISYYLNAHHVDFHCWCLTESRKDEGFWRPTSVTASGAIGRACKIHSKVKYDSITLLVRWDKFDSSANIINTGTAVYTASWISPKKGDVFSQQRFFYQGTISEVNVDQAHRGYTHVTEENGFQSPNPLFMKYTPDPQGYFSGQLGYGYRSLESFVDCVHAVKSNSRSIDDIVKSGELATISSNATILTTSILHAGARSLTENRTIQIKYGDVKDIINNPPSLH